MIAASSATAPVLEPIAGFEALDGCHCVTNSLAKIFRFHGFPLSEEMLFGLGAGLGFVYWRMKMGAVDVVFVGGRGNLKTFYQDLANRTGVEIRSMYTASAKKAEAELLRHLNAGEPVMLGGDMGMLPWFHFPAEYHFGGHTFVACGYDGQDTVLCSDMDQAAAGIKKGFLAPISLEQLRGARGSKFKPFPPENLRLEFDFAHARPPRRADVTSAIRQTVDGLLNPPIKNFGVPGLRHTAAELLRWPRAFDDHALRMNLFNLYIFIEIGGTGGGCFRPMYARFLRETATITGNDDLHEIADRFQQIGADFSRIGNLFREAATMPGLDEAIRDASATFVHIAEQEEAACRLLLKAV